MGYAVLHIEKGTKGKANGLGSHIDRTRHTPNADPEKSRFNLYLQIDHRIDHPLNQKCTNKRNPIPLQSRIDARIKEGYKGTTAIRKDAVTHLNIVLTGSHEEMIRVDPLTWFLINLQFVCNRFGRENVVEFALHMDERTPHIHCVVVPLTPDGRLSAKEVMGNRLKMTDLQDKYGEAMEMFGLQRGVKGSKATHDSVKEYYGRINQRLEMNTDEYKVREIDVDAPRIETPPLFNREDWAKKQNEAISANFSASLESIQAQAKKDIESASKELKTRMIQAEEKADRLRKEVAQLNGKIEELTKPAKQEVKPSVKQEIKKEQFKRPSQGMGL